LKVLIVDIDKCTGCMACTLECSFFHEKVYSKSHSRILIKRKEEKELSVPMMCEQCGIPVCVYACRVEDALTYNRKLLIPMVNEEKCTGCGLCVRACPFEAIRLDPVSKKAIVCDLCGGDPTCVKVCLPQAIRFEEVSKSILIKKVKAMSKKLQILEKEFEKRGDL